MQAEVQGDGQVETPVTSINTHDDLLDWLDQVEHDTADMFAELWGDAYDQQQYWSILQDADEFQKLVGYSVGSAKKWMVMQLDPRWLPEYQQRLEKIRWSLLQRYQQPGAKAAALLYRGRQYRAARWSQTVDRLQQDPDYDLLDVFPLASAEVDGRVVLDHVPNQGSIEATLEDYTIVPHIRAVPLSVFSGLDPHDAYYSRHDIQRTHELADAIKASNEIAPLIVVVDDNPEGPYILEGGHRSSALWLLGAVELPALVVLDEE